MRTKAFAAAILLFAVLAAGQGGPVGASGATGALKDGIYHGESQSRYTSEPYWGEAYVEVSGGRVARVAFFILDKSRDEVFDQNYEGHYKGNAAYVQQCRNELAALPLFLRALEATGDPDRIEAVSGATWSRNILRDSASIAIAKARK
jgi:major membrane immunogen (membrane-anchored lipoprotein)